MHLDGKLFGLSFAAYFSKCIRENLGSQLSEGSLLCESKLNVTGIVQGVGFRPFIYRIAVKNGLAGYVRNRGDAGVEVLVEGEAGKNPKFYARLN